MATADIALNRRRPSSGPMPGGSVAARAELAIAQPVLRSVELVDDPLAGSVQGDGSASTEDAGSIAVRRRASSVEAGSAYSRPGMHARAFVGQLAKDLERQSASGVNKGEREMQKAGFDRALIVEILACRLRYRPVMRALAGGGVHASAAQFAQALCLSVFDVNRQVFSLGLLPAKPGDELAVLPDGYDNEQLRMLVLGAQQLTEFRGLHDYLALWAELDLNPESPGTDGLYRHLTHDIGLFHTNAMRVLNAYAAARAREAASPLRHFPECLAAQWLTGPGEREREAIRRSSADESEQFHRKLGRQFERICQSFGSHAPMATELLLLDGQQ